ncbi:MAG TPA: 50S ribosomal protein L23 [Candidatus Nanoarchaeia archaeon]|nr:50S ribosomal protein L23 [Candidatus Nanoarchaeia archaeon]
MMPITTEKAVKILEKENTIIFCVDKRMRRQEIKKQIEDLWKVKVERINTLNKGNKKYAYAKLSKENPAIDLATKLGMI